LSTVSSFPLLHSLFPEAHRANVDPLFPFDHLSPFLLCVRFSFLKITSRRSLSHALEMFFPQRTVDKERSDILPVAGPLHCARRLKGIPPLTTFLLLSNGFFLIIPSTLILINFPGFSFSPTQDRCKALYVRPQTFFSFRASLLMIISSSPKHAFLPSFPDLFANLSPFCPDS